MGATATQGNYRRLQTEAPPSAAEAAAEVPATPEGTATPAEAINVDEMTVEKVESTAVPVSLVKDWIEMLSPIRFATDVDTAEEVQKVIESFVATAAGDSPAEDSPAEEAPVVEDGSPPGNEATAEPIVLSSVKHDRSTYVQLCKLNHQAGNLTMRDHALALEMGQQTGWDSSTLDRIVRLSKPVSTGSLVRQMAMSKSPDRKAEKPIDKMDDPAYRKKVVDRLKGVRG